ncbi:hypothetical protein LBMAG53_21650 [Planctomycetota bacterium]|nr:hypothetical protein LBMAG53_21650 [Planctomycetota bacterium]
MRSPSQLLAIVFAVGAGVAPGLASEGQVGPFRWGRWLLNPDAPTQQATPADPSQIERASLLSGDADSGVIDLLGWQGTNQAGTISFAGNSFLAAPGTTWWIGSPTWDIQRGSQTNGTWSYVRRLQQDWRIHLGYCERSAAELSAAHGAPARIGSNLLGVNAVVVELDGRWVSNTVGGWTTNYYSGNPPNCGVWAVPAGMSINSAQQNAANRLASFSTFLSGTTPRTGPWKLDFRVGAGGTWVVELDTNGDGVTDRTLTSRDAGMAASPFSGITGQSGLMLSVEASAANGLGSVGRTPMQLSYQTSVADAPPVVSVVSGSFDARTPTRVALSATASDDRTTSLPCAWTILSGPSGSGISPGSDAFHVNLTVAAAGTYQIQATVTDRLGQTGSKTATIVVPAIPVSGSVTPASALPIGQSQTFTATWTDQFGQLAGNAVSSWAVDRGTIDAQGRFTAVGPAGPVMVTATTLAALQADPTNGSAVVATAVVDVTTAPSEGQLGPFRWGRWRLDPNAPTAAAQPADPIQVEAGTLVTGDQVHGRIDLRQWQGTNQAGTITFAGNALLAPPETTWWIGLPSWDIQRGTQSGGLWTYTRRTQQDWRLHLGYADRPAAALSALHGQPSKIGSSDLGADAIVLELDGRWISPTVSGWTTGYYSGNPPNCGVWAVPAGQSINSAQQQVANRLADLTAALTGFAPANGQWAVDFRVAAGGSWSLAIDRTGDGIAELRLTSSDPGNHPSPFTSITGQSGLLLSMEASAANALGTVGRSPVTVAYQRTTDTPPQVTLPSGLTTGETELTVTASASDDGGIGGLTWVHQWVGTPPAPAVLIPGSNGSVTIRFTKIGTYRLRSTATDAAGASTSAETDIVVVPTPTAVTTTLP